MGKVQALKSENISSSFRSECSLITQELQVAELNGKKVSSVVVFILTCTSSRIYFVLPPFHFYLLDKEILCFISGVFLGTYWVELILFRKIDLQVFSAIMFPDPVRKSLKEKRIIWMVNKFLFIFIWIIFLNHIKDILNVCISLQFGFGDEQQLEDHAERGWWKLIGAGSTRGLSKEKRTGRGGSKGSQGGEPPQREAVPWHWPRWPTHLRTELNRGAEWLTVSTFWD